MAVVGERTDVAISPKTDDGLPDRTKTLLLIGTHVVFPTIACVIQGLGIPIVKGGGVLGLQDAMEIDTASVSRTLSMLEACEGCYANKNRYTRTSITIMEWCIATRANTSAARLPY